MKKIIFICYIPLTNEFEKNFYINELLANEFRVEYWDVASIYFKNIKFEGSIDRDYIKKINSLKKLKGMLKSEDIKDVIFFPVITYSGKVFRLFRLLSKMNCTTFFIERGALPTSNENLSFLYKILSVLGNPGRLHQHILNKIVQLLKKIKFIKNYDMVFFAGSLAVDKHKRCPNIIPINHFDYDDYLLNKEKADKLINYKYCVFLDDNIVHDTDFKMLDIKTVTAEKYYDSMNRFFDFIENEYRLKVIIAAHPKSSYDPGLFGARKVYKNKTNELTKESAFVIAHYSTSISYAILYKKPVLFIYTNEMRKMGFFDIINNFATVLNCNMYNIDSLHDKNNIQFKDVDPKRYDKYKYTYLTSRDSETIISKETVLKYLKDYR